MMDISNKIDIANAVGCILAMGVVYFNFTTSIVKISNKIWKRKIPKQRRFWVNPLNTVQKRRQQGDHFNLIREMRQFDPSRFTQHLRMSPKLYDKLFKLVAPLITKAAGIREPIDAGTKLEITLRYLASGESCISLANQFRVGRSTVPNILDETLAAIYQVLKDKVLVPPTRQTFLNISEGFWNKWNFPNCIGAIDGKHIEIIAPPNSGSKYFNYLNYNSIVLLAVCDYRYRFTMVDVGSPGRRSDGGILQDSNIGKRFERNMMDLPEPSPISIDGPALPYFMVGDEAFGLKSYMQRPFPGRTSGNLSESKKIFNYRLSRARRVIENSFGILATKWRIFRQPIQASVQKVEAIILAAVCLHNFLLIEEEETKPHQKTYLHSTLVDREVNGSIIQGDWRKDLDPIHFQTFTNAFMEESEDDETDNEENKEVDIIYSQIVVRKELKEFFMTSGNVSWQFTEYIN